MGRGGAFVVWSSCEDCVDFYAVKSLCRHCDLVGEPGGERAEQLVQTFVNESYAGMGCRYGRPESKGS